MVGEKEAGTAKLKVSEIQLSLARSFVSGPVWSGQPWPCVLSCTRPSLSRFLVTDQDASLLCPPGRQGWFKGDASGERLAASTPKMEPERVKPFFPTTQEASYRSRTQYPQAGTRIPLYSLCSPTIGLSGAKLRPQTPLLMSLIVNEKVRGI